MFMNRPSRHIPGTGTVQRFIQFSLSSTSYHFSKEFSMTIDTGNTGFMILCSSLVMLMTPGLAFFYGGLVGRKNVLAIMIQSFVSLCWTTVLWYAVGYSLC